MSACVYIQYIHLRLFYGISSSSCIVCKWWNILLSCLDFLSKASVSPSSAKRRKWKLLHLTSATNRSVLHCILTYIHSHRINHTHALTQGSCTVERLVVCWDRGALKKKTKVNVCGDGLIGHFGLYFIVNSLNCLQYIDISYWENMLTMNVHLFAKFEGTSDFIFKTPLVFLCTDACWRCK